MKLLDLILLILLTSSCSNQNHDLYVFNPVGLGGSKITLDDLADDIIYVPLDNQYPIGLINRLIINKNNIFLSSHDGIFSYSRDGKLPGKIGNKGRGPGEYVYDTDFTVGDIKGTVYIRDIANIIKVFSSKGEYIRSIPMDKFGGAIDALETFQSNILITYCQQFGDSRNEWVLIDTLGNLIESKERRLPKFNSNWLANGGIYKVENRISYWNPYVDTVFSILPDLSYKGSFIISHGEHRLPLSGFDVDKQITRYMSIYNLFETNRFLIIKYAYNKKGVLALIEKKSRKSYLAYWESPEIGGIVNNLDGGLPLQPLSYFTETGREYLVAPINPYKLITLVNSSEFKNSTPKYPDMKKALEKLANSLKETDNPVLMIVRLKS